MRALYLPPLLTLTLVIAPAFAQDQATGPVADDAARTGARAEADTAEQGPNEGQEQNKRPALRKEHQPGEEISKDKAVAFPADI